MANMAKISPLSVVMVNETCDLRTIGQISYLYKWANFIGLVPPFDFKDLAKKPRGGRCLPIFLLFIVIATTVIFIITRILFVYPVWTTNSLMILDVSRFTTFNAFSITAIVIQMNYREHFHEFLISFLHIDARFQTRIGNVETTLKLYSRLIILQLIFVFICAYDAYVWSSAMGVIVYLQYFWQLLQIYHIFVFFLIVDITVCCLRSRFRAINHLLQKMYEANNYNGGKVLYVKPDEMLLATKYFIEIYKLLIKQVCYFNKIFGIQVMLTTISLITAVLSCFNIMIDFPHIKERYPWSGSGILVSSCIWCAFFMINQGFFCYMCQQTNDEARHTGCICFDQISKLPSQLQSQDKEVIKEELRFLADLAQKCYPNISAAGFYTVNYSTMLTIFSTVTSYIIVLLQFNK